MKTEYYSGRVIKVIYRGPDNGYYVLLMELDPEEGPDDSAFSFDFTPSENRKTAKVSGKVLGLGVKEGTWFGFQGSWVDNPKYGRQLAIKQAPIIKGSWTPVVAERVLSSYGVGSRLLHDIRKKVGDEKFISVLGNSKKLQKDAEIDKKTADFIVETWATIRIHFETLSFLDKLKLPSAIIKKIWYFLGVESKKTLLDNPWVICFIKGIDFSTADSLAMKMGKDLSDPNRILGAVYQATCEGGLDGHLYHTINQILNALHDKIPEATPEETGAALRKLVDSGKVVVERKIRKGLIAIYTPYLWKLETETSRMLEEKVKYKEDGGTLSQIVKYSVHLAKTMGKKEPKGDEDAVRFAIQDWSTQSKISLSQTQIDGVCHALSKPVSILTGLPGTGKTTSLEAVVQILEEASVNFLLCAPTGIAAKRLQTVTGHEASTIHRAFGAKGGYGEEGKSQVYAGVLTQANQEDREGEADIPWDFDQDNPHPAQVVIVDEASMVDQHLMYRLLSCTDVGAKLVIVGDPAQLPSVGPGNVLRELIKSNVFPCTHLTEIFRQEDTSDIIFAAHDIFNGKVPTPKKGGDFIMQEMTNEGEIRKFIVKAGDQLSKGGASFQILSPRWKGEVGVTILNSVLREKINPAQTGLKEAKVSNNYLIREDDRIMVIKNDYERKIYNGDVGRVSSINDNKKQFFVEIEGPSKMLVAVKFHEVESLLRLTYACTVHKAQGLEYDVIVMPLVESFQWQLQRNLLYTAITRAKKKVLLVGSMEALRIAVANDRVVERNTLLRDRLQLWFVEENENESKTKAKKNTKKSKSDKSSCDQSAKGA